jgi:hypothetical protein
MKKLSQTALEKLEQKVIRDLEIWFTQEVVPFEQLDNTSRWCPAKSPKNMRNILFWGKISPPKKNQPDFSLSVMGIIPRTLWPLSMAGAIWSKGAITEFKGRNLSEHIFELLDKNLTKSLPDDGRVMKDKLQSLFTAKKYTYPPEDWAEHLETACIKYFCDRFPYLDLREVTSATRDTNYTTPVDVLKALLPLNNAKQVGNQIDPELSTNLDTYSDIIERNLAEMRPALIGQSKRVIILKGNSFGGKTQTIIELINRITNQNGSELQALRVNPEELRIFAGHCKQLPFSKILDKVFNFWVTEDLRLANLQSIDDQTKWDIVEREAKKPAFYIFNCVKIAERNSRETYFAGRSFGDLAEMLLARNSKTRIVIAGSKIKILSRENSTFNYLSNQSITAQSDARKAILESCLTMLPDETVAEQFEELAKKRSLGLKDTEIKCPAMLAFTSLTGLKGELDLKATNMFLGLGECSVAERELTDRENKFFNYLWEGFLEQAGTWSHEYDGRHFQRVFKILTATYDAVYVSSIKLMLDKWQEAYPLPKKKDKGRSVDPQNVPSEEDIHEFVQSWAKQTDSRLINLSKHSSLLEYEKLPTELERPQYCESDIRIDQPIRGKFETEFNSTGYEELLICRRLIAGMARIRAKQIRLNSRLPFGARISDVERDVQAALELLSSVDRVCITPCCEKSPHPYEWDDDIQEISEDDAFGLHNLRNISEVVKFIYFHMVPNEINRGERLSMIQDSDKTLLLLLSSLVKGVGEKYGEEEKTERTSDACLNDGLGLCLPKILPPIAQVELLEDMGVAAFYLGQIPVLDAAYERVRTIYKKFRETENSKNFAHLDVMRTALERLRCFVIDDCILKYDRRNDIQQQTLSTMLEEVNTSLDNIKLIIKNDLKRFRTEQRLLERKLQIFRLMRYYIKKAKRKDHNKQELSVIKEINVCHRKIIKNTKDLSGEFGGRLCRSLFYSILGNLAFEDTREERWKNMGWEEETVATELDKYLTLTTARLAKYSGAERASALAMYALKALFDKDFIGGLRYAQQAHNAAQFSNVSRGVKVQLSWILCQAKFLALKHAKQNAEGVDKEVENLILDIKFLDKAAESGSFFMHRDFALRLQKLIEDQWCD